MCCGSGGNETVENQDLALQKAANASEQTLMQNYSSAFASQQTILNRVAAQMSAQMANPQGYTPQQLAGMRTSVNENTATAAKQALGTAGAYAARFGAADVGSGVAGQFAGEAASNLAQNRAKIFSNINEQNAQLKQQNYWHAVEGLNQAGAGFGSSAGSALGGASNMGNLGVTAGKGTLDAVQNRQSTFGGLVSAAGAGLEMAAGL